MSIAMDDSLHAPRRRKRNPLANTTSGTEILPTISILKPTLGNLCTIWDGNNSFYNLMYRIVNIIIRKKSEFKIIHIISDCNYT